MSYLIGILTFILFLDCLLLTLLILVQLPKKEAGMGQAFGGGATDALFGAGAGNALTKLTKWAASIFMGLALLLSMLSVATSKKASTARDAFTENTGPSASGIAAVTNASAAASNAAPPVNLNNVISAVPTENTSTNAQTNLLTTTTIVTNAAGATNISNLTNAVKTNTAPLLNSTSTNAGNLLQTITATAKSGLNTVSNTAVKAVEDVKKEIPKTDDKK